MLAISKHRLLMIFDTKLIQTETEHFELVTSFSLSYGNNAMDTSVITEFFLV